MGRWCTLRSQQSVRPCLRTERWEHPRHSAKNFKKLSGHSLSQLSMYDLGEATCAMLCHLGFGGLRSRPRSCPIKLWAPALALRASQDAVSPGEEQDFGADPGSLLAFSDRSCDLTPPRMRRKVSPHTQVLCWATLLSTLPGRGGDGPAPGSRAGSLVTWGGLAEDTAQKVGLGARRELPLVQPPPLGAADTRLH